MNSYLKFYCYLLVWALTCTGLQAFDQVVIWGHKPHTHTHAYVHEAFYKAFQYLGYRTFWFDNDSDVSNFDFTNTLFLTEGQVDQEIPLRNDCNYILHNCSTLKYAVIEPQNQIKIQVYTDDVLTCESKTKVDDCIYYVFSDQCCYMPWATDLLPYEIDEIKEHMQKEGMSRCVNWVGTIGGGLFGNIDQLEPFQRACQENGIEFIHTTHVDTATHKELIQASYMAPTIVGGWQEEKGYIPCRIFKNISYGKMGITNSQRVYELFQGKIVFNPDTYQLFYDAQKAQESMSLEQLYELMDFVKTKHTYINRIQLLLDFFERIRVLNSAPSIESGIVCDEPA